MHADFLRKGTACTALALVVGRKTEVSVHVRACIKSSTGGGSSVIDEVSD
jgi:hypothetical protein